MATDPNLSDNNLPNSSANLGWEDWTGSKGALSRDLEWVIQAFIKHLGPDYWNSRNEYPHPNQAVALVYFMEGNARLFPGGIQFVQTDTAPPPTISVVSDQFTDTPATSYPNFLLAPNVYVGSAPKTLDLGINLGSGQFYGLEVEAGGPTDIIALRFNGPSGPRFGYSDTESDWAVTGAPFRWYNVTADSGSIDGDSFYRTDTHVFRGLKNGVFRTFLMDDYVPVLTSLDVPFNAYSANQLLTSTNCFVTMDASGASRTFTLPSAATLGAGFTYVFKKIDSSNNTVTIDPNSTQTVDGVTTYVLTKQYETLCATSDGTNWVIWSAYNNELYVAQTATFTVGPRDTVISVSTAAGAVTANLPTAVGIAGREITIKKTTTDANALTVDPSSTQTIDGISTYVMTSQGELGIYSDGANWQIKNASFDGYVARTTAYTSTMADRVIACDMASGAYTVTLLAAASCQGQTLTIIKTTSDANLLTIDANSSETINGVITVGITQQYGSYTLFSTGAAWLIIGATS